MNNDSQNIALVTGGARRIGRAIALDLATHGWQVAVHFHTSREAALELVDEIRATGGDAVALGADLGDEEETGRLIAQAGETLGPVSLLVNNASVFERDEFASATRESWDLHMNVNLRAPFVLSQRFVAALGQTGRGNIINILDQRVWRLTPRFMSYTLSKAGLWTLTQTMAQALAPRVRVNAIGPGPVLPSPRQSDESFTAQARALPLQRRTEPGEICAAVRFILESPSMTGQMIALDGGQHLAWQTPDVIGQEE
ncbi:MAG: SDR family oxidoreductase [Alphaproteobacteria bacterium]|nr:MAG: SDR family oxidoreductase [Alphaproteobacteria bacterium]